MAGLLALAIFTFTSGSLRAAEFTWVGDTDDKWSQKKNWNPDNDNPNSVDDKAIFDGTADIFTLTLDKDRTVGTIEFNSITDYTLDGSGKKIKFKVSSGNAAFDVLVSTGDVTINFKLKLDNADLDINHLGSGALFFTSEIDLNEMTLTVTGTGDTTITGKLKDNKTASNLTKAGTGTLLLTSVVSDYGGTTTVREGILKLGGSTPNDGNAGVLGKATSNVELGDASTPVAGNISLLTTGAFTIARNIDVNNQGGTITIGGAQTSGTSTFSGNVVLAKGVSLTSASGGTAEFSGVISETATSGVTKTGGGIVVLSNNNTYTGTTTVSDGNLRISNSSALGDLTNGTTVANGATLSLDGVGTAEALTLNGTGDGSVGALHNFSGDNTVSGTISLNTSSSIGAVSGTTLIATGVISGANNSLTKVGTGTLILTGTNTYTGTTTVSNGTLELSNGSAIVDTGAVVLANVTNTILHLNASETIGDLSGGGGTGGNIELDTFTLTTGANGTTTYSGAISGSGSLIKAGSGSLTLDGTNSYTGTTTVRSGTLGIGSNAPSGSNGALGNATSTVELGDSSTGGSDNISLIITNSGVTVARNIDVNNFGATTTMGGSFTSGTSTFSGDIALNKNITLTSATGGTVDFTGVISEDATARNVTKTGGGTVVLKGSNTFTGDVTINAGTLRVNGGSAIDDNASVVLANVSGAVFDLAGSFETIGDLSGGGSNGGNVTLGGGFFSTGNSNNSTTFDGIISGAGTLFKTGTGTFTLTGSNTYTGATSINKGIVQIENANALGNASTGTTVTNGATLVLSKGSGSDITFAAEQLTLNGVGVGGNGALRNISGDNTWQGNIPMFSDSTIGVDSGTKLTISGVISGTPNLTKNGDGTLVLSGSNTYSGTTTITAGTVVLSSSGALTATTAVNITNGTLLLGSDSDQINDSANITLDSAGFGTQGFDETLTGTLTLNGDSYIDLNGGDSILKFGDSSAVTWTAGKVLTITNWDGIFNDGGGNDQIIFGSTMGGLDSQIDQIYFLNPKGEDGMVILGFFSAQILANGEIIPVMVPEASTLFGGFMILGVAGAHIWQRRRKSVAKQLSD